ncbi:MAG: hypothetical protein COV74_10670 [Candidatus Omnitrophica bacterium CG11_big_fil_rev_8_21_14_0_20_45_26]|uniref:DUF2490 domain-containing protein n=1 Tax=Candidatus Abzuiibacterium crystallinum TaxID=1974748 RepID=A0A2H0LKV5_9BACT|nr:MAG: hypothetical protein COV74_10670 [Candidatus Omnitrophica bacterium CG11_big_fil_rev_8_21_14_0_20_45_26]PIW63871.1 MAG: hypothetical protein COW12_08140 [Candidatus Omnitrophica bacterium CG12_big_fil_rev_8_21_14_0_65_45_16]
MVSKRGRRPSCQSPARDARALRPIEVIVKLKRFILCLIGFIVIAIPSSLARDDAQYWSQYSIKWLDTKYVDLVNFWDVRFTDDWSHVGLWFTRQQVRINPWKHLGFNVAYTYLETEVQNAAKTQNEYKYHHRLELELNPSWNLPNDWKLSNRNRVEFRWIEDKGSDNTRFRQLWELEVPVKKLRIESVYLNNELFYDFSTQKFNEDRITPFGVKIKVCSKAYLKLFYLIQCKKGARDWSSNQVFGTQVGVTF